MLLKPIENDIERFNWLVNDLEINTSEMQKLPIDHDKDWFLINSEQMNTLRKTDTQIIWGTFLAIDKT